MDNTVLVALISAGGSVLVAVTALVLNYRGFTSLENRMTSIENRLGALEARVHNDFLEFYKALADLDKRLTRLEDGRK